MLMAKLGKSIDFYRGQYRARVTVPERLRPFIVKPDGTPRSTLEKRLGNGPEAGQEALLRHSRKLLRHLGRGKVPVRASKSRAGCCQSNYSR